MDHHHINDCEQEEVLIKPIETGKRNDIFYIFKIPVEQFKTLIFQ